MKHIISLLLFSSALTSFAATSDYYPQNFYDSVKASRDQELKDKLFNVLNSYHIKQTNAPDTVVATCSGDNCYRHIMLSYNQARRLLFGKLELQKDSQGYFIKDVYCEEKMRASDIGPDSIPDAKLVNCEHTWPQSKFSNSFPRDLQKGDLHHLYSTNSQANSTRGNNPFGEVVNGENPASNCNASQIGGIASAPGGRYFEPPNAHKGNVARSLFYFSVRYKIAIDPTQEATLKQWNKLDPVDDAERARNDFVYDVQKDRNPFIDFPELVELISDF